MLENPNKKFFMLYTRFVQMILDAKYPELVKSTDHLNLKPMGPRCFENACKERDAKKHNFIGRIPLETHKRFRPVAPAPQSLNSTVVEEHDVQHNIAGTKADVETEVLVTDEEESDDDNDVEVIMSEETEEPVRQPTLMTAENLQPLIESLKDSIGNPPSVPISEIEVCDEDDVMEDAEQASNKRQRTGTTPDIQQTGPSTEPEPTLHTDSQVTAATQETSTKDFDFDFEFDLPKTTSQSQPESSSGI
ncbi:hypothetical protein Hanom_Chr08g00747171 [Helianthus anomalus]